MDYRRFEIEDIWKVPILFLFITIDFVLIYLHWNYF